MRVRRDRRRDGKPAGKPSGKAVRGYKFTNKTHPAKAIFSLILGCISLFGVCAVVYLSFAAGGATKPGYGLTGLLAVIFSLIGTVLAVMSFRDRNSFYVLSWAGTILNVLVLVGVGFLFSLGI